MKITPAGAQDESSIRQLLHECELPSEDIQLQDLAHFFVCHDGGGLIGLVGLQLCESAALLRSLAVSPLVRGRGLGRRLVARAEDHARSSNVTRLYLLTTTAKEFFASHGYDAIDRSAAPHAIQQTAEFTSLCPSSSVCMVKPLLAYPQAERSG
jgi:amino-acid N-acetyltransferase